MERNLRQGLQTAIAQTVCWLSLDHDGAKALHDQAVEDGTIWPVNMALLYMLDKALRQPDMATDEVIAILRDELSNLATQEDDEQGDDEKDDTV